LKYFCYLPYINDMSTASNKYWWKVDHDSISLYLVDHSTTKPASEPESWDVSWCVNLNLNAQYTLATTLCWLVNCRISTCSWGEHRPFHWFVKADFNAESPTALVQSRLSNLHRKLFLIDSTAQQVYGSLQVTDLEVHLNQYTCNRVIISKVSK